MRHSEILSLLQKLTNHKPTQQEIADILSVNLGTVSARDVRNSKYSNKELIKIGNKYNVNLLENTINYGKTEETTQNILTDYYPEMQISIGNNNYELTGSKEKMSVPQKLINSYSSDKKYSIIKAAGDSMLPSIHDGDKLIIEHQNFFKIVDNRVYVFFYDNKFLCKRLILNIDKLVIMSDNPDKSVYPTEYIINNEMERVHIIGKVVGSIREWE